MILDKENEWELAMINLVVIAGHLAADPELHLSRNGQVQVCTFPLTATCKQNGHASTFLVVSFYGQAESAATHLRQGHVVTVEGSLHERRTDDGRSVAEIRARAIHFFARAERATR